MKLLQLKHWQLFLITFVVPFVLYLTGMIIFATKMILAGKAARFNHHFQPQLSDFIIPIVFGIISLLVSLVNVAWMYQIGTKLQAFMHPEMRKLKVNRFKLFFFFPLIYIFFCIAVFVPFIMNTVQAAQHQETPNVGAFMLLFLLMFIGHFFSFFCIIYSFYFLAKTLKSVELQREAHFNDYIGEFFLFWFFPVGVWFIQPKVNKMIDNQFTSSSDFLRSEQLDL